MQEYERRQLKEVTHLVVPLGFPFFKNVLIGKTGESVETRPVWEIQGWVDSESVRELTPSGIKEVSSFVLSLVKQSVQLRHPDKFIKEHLH
ncbi:MAG: hypothetical protein V1834_02035 [Candidatus Micrarchaeota archaeon]